MSKSNLNSKQQEKKLSNMRILQNVIFVVFIALLATHNFALRQEITEQEKDISERELILKSSIRDLRLEEKKWREGYAAFEANKPEECKKLLEAAAAEEVPAAAAEPLPSTEAQ